MLLIIRVVKRVTEVKYIYRSFLITFALAQWSKGHLISVLFEGHRVESFLGVITFDRIKIVRAQHFSLPIKMFVKILSVLDSNPQPCLQLNRVLESVNSSHLLNTELKLYSPIVTKGFGLCMTTLIRFIPKVSLKRSGVDLRL